MTRDVVVVDYGVGNLRSVARALEVVGANARVSSCPREIAASDRLVLPGVGAFRACAEALRAAGLWDPVRERLGDGRPALGICVGLQILFEASHEFGETEGLGLLPGAVEHIPVELADGGQVRAPFIGWSPIAPGRAGSWDGAILRNLSPGEELYFVHSYAVRPTDPAIELAVTDYGAGPVCAAVFKDALCGVQFHPERSGPAGLRILDAFVSL